MRRDPSGIPQLRQELNELFDRFIGREDWMPARMFRSMRTFRDEMDELLQAFFGPQWGPTTAGFGTPRIESRVKEGHLALIAEIPGYRPDEVKVTLADYTLEIEGEHKSGKGDPQEQRRFTCRYTLPAAVDPAQVNARLQHGILEIKLPAMPKTTGKQIPIEAGGGAEQKHLKAA